MPTEIKKRNAGLVLGFVPLIVYGVLAAIPGIGIVTALAAAAVASVVFGYRDLRSRMLLSWANLLLFGFLLLVIGGLGIGWIVPFNSVVVYGSLAAVSFGSIVTGRPFTLQYAKQAIDRSFWESPVFIRANVVITGAWTAVFLAGFVLNVLALTGPLPGFFIAQLLSYGFIAAGILFTLWYPRYLRANQGMGRH